MNPILIVALIALVAVIYAVAATVGLHYGYKIGMKEVEVEHKACQADLAIANNRIEQMECDLDTLAERREQEHAQTTKLRDDLMVTMTTIKQLHAENADLREALQEAQAEIKALNMRTIEMPEAAATSKPSGRTLRRGKASATGLEAEGKKAETKQ